MKPDELAYRRRVVIIGNLAALFWIILSFLLCLAFLGLADLTRDGGAVPVTIMLIAWGFTVAWAGLGAYCRRTNVIGWMALVLFTGPAGAGIYLLCRPWIPDACLRCGAMLPMSGACPACGYEGGTRQWLARLQSSLADSLVRGLIDKTKHTIKFINIALAATFVLTHFAIRSYSAWNVPAALQILNAISGAGYWVLTAWWVYLDATWRKMSAVPWAVLTLVTNIIGLVTYLVIRYPDPRMCLQCGAELPNGVKRCPYCGVETEPICPHCESPVQPDWAFCPACAGKLPDMTIKPASPATVSISGNVIDSTTGSPVPGAEVRIDSRTLPVSASADASGRFVLPNLSPRPYVLVASADGYTEQVKTYEPQPNGPSQVSFSLVPKREARRETAESSVDG